MKLFIKYYYYIILLYPAFIFGENKFIFENNKFWMDLVEIIENHPKIKSQVTNLASKIEQYNYKKTYYPDPRFGIMWANIPYNKKLKFDFEKYEMSGIEYSIMQPIPFPGKLTLESKIENIEVEKERLLLAKEYNELTKQILSLLVSYYTYKKIYSLLDTYLKKFNIITESSKIKYSTGKGNLFDFSKAILVEKKLKENQVEIKGLIDTYKENLNYYYVNNELSYEDLEYEPFVINYIESHFNNELNIENSIKNSTYYNIAEIALKIQDEKIKLQKYDYYPDFDITLSYMKREKLRDKPESGEDLMSFGISFRLPLWGSYANRNEVNSKEKQLENSKWNLEEVKLNLKTKLQEINVDIHSIKERLKLYSTVLIPQAELSYNSALQNYTVGKIDFDALSMIWMDLFELHKEKYLLEKELWIRKIQFLEISNQILPDFKKIKEVYNEN